MEDEKLIGPASGNSDSHADYHLIGLLHCILKIT